MTTLTATHASKRAALAATPFGVLTPHEIDSLLAAVPATARSLGRQTA